MKDTREILRDNLIRLMDKYDKKRSDVCHDCGIPYTTFSDWLRGYRYPRVENLETLAEYFHCSMSELLEEEKPAYYLDKDAAELAEFLRSNPNYQVLFDASRKVAPEDIQKVKAMIDLMSNK